MPEEAPAQPVTPEFAPDTRHGVSAMTFAQGAMLGIAVLIIALFAAYLFLKSHGPVVDGQSSTATSTYASNVENIRFSIPDGWYIDASTTAPLPPGYTQTIFTLRKSGSACVVTEAHTEQKAIGYEADRISFADRVFSAYSQFDGSWEVASTSANAAYAFSYDTRQYIPGEYRTAWNGRNDPFLLLMSDGSTVSDDCNADFNMLLRSSAPYFETARLDASSRGTLAVDKVWSDIDPDQSYEHLLFAADGSNEKREVMRLPPGTAYATFSVSGNKLYVSGDPSNYAIAHGVSAVDPFAGTITIVPGTEAANVLSSYVYDGTVYYLADSQAPDNCTDVASCTPDAYSIPLTGGTATFLGHSMLTGKGSDYGSILGYVPSEHALYVMSGYGDAGCSSDDITKIADGTGQEVASYSGCSEDPAQQSLIDGMQKIRQTAQAGKLLAGTIRVEYGMLLPGSDAASDTAAFEFDK